MVIPRYGGVATFQPFDVIEKGGWLESHGGRAAAFFCSAAWALGSMTTNISKNPFFFVPLLLADAFCLASSCQQCIECQRFSVAVPEVDQHPPRPALLRRRRERSFRFLAVLNAPRCLQSCSFAFYGLAGVLRVCSVARAFLCNVVRLLHGSLLE